MHAMYQGWDGLAERKVAENKEVNLKKAARL
jgi:hypothetical protein